MTNDCDYKRQKALKRRFFQFRILLVVGAAGLAILVIPFAEQRLLLAISVGVALMVVLGLSYMYEAVAAGRISRARARVIQAIGIALLVLGIITIGRISG